MVKKLNTAEFDELLKSSSLPVICDFYSNTCGPCRMLAPVLEELSEDYSGKAELVKVNVDDDFELAIRYKIQSIPFVAAFKGGEVADISIGFMPKSEAKEFIENNL